MFVPPKIEFTVSRLEVTTADFADPITVPVPLEFSKALYLMIALIAMIPLGCIMHCFAKKSKTCKYLLLGYYAMIVMLFFEFLIIGFGLVPDDVTKVPGLKNHTVAALDLVT